MLLLVAVGALAQLSPIDPSQGRTCLREKRAVGLSNVLGLSALFDSQKSIRVHQSNWASARVVTALAEIILREELDFQVQVYQAAAGDSLTYKYIGDHLVDVNFERWPALDVKKAEKNAARLQTCGPSFHRVPCLRLSGSLGYSGRSGWYLLNSTLPQTLVLDGATVGSQDGQGDFVSYFGYNESVAHAISRGNWANLDFLASPFAISHFLRAGELPVLNTCSVLQAHMANTSAATRGLYSCLTGSWTPHNAPCCPRSGVKTDGSACAPGESQCLALVVDEPTYDLDTNELILANSGLPFEIVYADVPAALAQAKGQGRPLLLYHWEPDFFMRESGPSCACPCSPTSIARAAPTRSESGSRVVRATSRSNRSRRASTASGCRTTGTWPSFSTGST